MEKMRGEAEKFYDEMLESERRYLQEKERLESENARIAEVNRQREYKKRLAAAKNATNAEIVKQNEILRRKKLADEEYLAQLKQTAEAEKKLMEQMKEQVREIYSDIAEYAKDSMGDTIRAQEKMEKKLSDFGILTKRQIFRNAAEDGGDLEYTILADIDPQIEAMERYATVLGSVRDKMKAGGFSQTVVDSFFAAMADLSVEDGTQLAQLLDDAKTEEFSDYIGKWEKKQQLSDTLSKQLYSESFAEAVEDAKEYMIRKLSEAGLEIPDGFFLSGSLSAENFGTAFIEEMQLQMEKVRTLAESFAISFSPVSIQGMENSGQGVSYHNATTYVLNSSGETVAQQLQAIDAAEMRSKMRGK